MCLANHPPCPSPLYPPPPPAAAASYQHAFGFIRQLAVLLRSALTAKSREAYREVYCWQTLLCLELWAKLLAARADEPQLRPLVYPVAQLLLGVARLVPAPAYFPLRLRCARALNRLGESTRTFVPVAPLLLEVLQWGDLRRAPKPGVGQSPDVLLTLRASKAAMRGTQYQEEVISQVRGWGRGARGGAAGGQLGWMR